MVWHRPASMLATLLALVFAVAMVTACGALLESGLRFHGAIARYAAAPVVVAKTAVSVTEGSGDDREVDGETLAERGELPAGLVARVAAAPGVGAAVTDTALAADVRAGGRTVALELHPWQAARLTPFGLSAGRVPAAPGQVVLDEEVATRLGVHPGNRIVVTTRTGSRALTVTGTATPAGTAPQAPTAFVSAAQLRSLGAAGPQVLGVQPAAGVGTDELARSVRAVLPAEPQRLFGSYPHVFTGAGRGTAETLAVGSAREYVIALSSVFGGATVLIAIFVVAGTVGLSVRQRHRDIALLRAIAATPRQVRRMVVREALLLAVLAAALGSVPGLAATGWLADRFVARGLAPASFAARLSWLPPVVASGAVLLAAVGAAWTASLRASRIRPTAALGEAAIERRGVGALRALAGIVALGGGVTLCIVSAHLGQDAISVAIATVACLVLAVGLLGPALVAAAAALPGRVLQLAGVPARLAVANSATSGRRLSAVLVSLVLAVALGGSLWFVFTSEQHTASAQMRAGLVATEVVTPAGVGLPASTAASLRTVDGVTAAVGVVRSTMFSPQSGVEDITAQGLDRAGLERAVDLDVTAGRLRDLGAGTVALDRLTAHALHLHLGGEFVGWFGDGAPARLRVVAIYTRGLGFAELTVSRATLAAHTASGLDDAVFVNARADAMPRLRAALDRIGPGATVTPRGAFRARLSAQLTENAWADQVVVAVLLVYVVIAAVNTLVMYTADRRRDFGVLRLVGTTRRQILGMVLAEQALLLGVVLLVGGAIAAAALVPSVKGVTGSAVPYIPPLGWVAVVGGVLMLGTVAGMVPARRVLRTGPVEAVAVRE
jgi:putative ABC transport system permease protein